MLVQQQLLLFCFVCICLQIASECNSKHEMNNERNMGVCVPLRAVIYHGILKLLTRNYFTIAGTVPGGKIFHKLREQGTRVGAYLSDKLEYTYLAQYCLISFPLPCLLICSCIACALRRGQKAK